MAAKGWGWEWGMTINGYKISFGGDENVLEVDRLGCATVDVINATKLCNFKWL